MATEGQRKQFGKALRAARDAEGLSQSQVAQMLSDIVAPITPAGVGNWERGLNEPGRKFMAPLEALLNQRGKLSPLLGYSVRHPTAPRRVRPGESATLESLAESLDGFAREMKVLSQTVRKLARGGG